MYFCLETLVEFSLSFTIVFKPALDLPVVFVRWEEVIKIEKSPEKPWQGVLKKWFGFPKEKDTKLKEKGTESSTDKGQVIRNDLDRTCK